jgi:hypothetical protein
VVPVISGLAVATGAAQVTHAFRISLAIAAAVAAAAAPLSFIGLRPRTVGRRTARRMYCAVDGPPLQPDPELCPEPELVA